MIKRYRKIPSNPINEKLEVELARHLNGAKYEVRKRVRGTEVRAFYVRKPRAKVKDCNYFVWDLENKYQVK